MLLEDYKEGGVDVGALDGIRVLDLSRLLPGPYCSMLLADFGAEVIKIEEPGRGDYSRSFPPFQNGFGYWHLQLNRNKKSVVLDLKSDAGRAAFLKLAQTADVVLESYRPGVCANFKKAALPASLFKSSTTLFLLRFSCKCQYPNPV